MKKNAPFLLIPEIVTKKTAVIAYGFSDHYLDHLAPLSLLWQLPFYCTEEKLYLLAKEFYPSLDIHYLPIEEFFLFITRNFDTVISCLPRPIIQADFAFAEDLLDKKIFSLWCPHGNSDKGKTLPFMEALQAEKHLLIYGKKMASFLLEKGVFAPFTHVGNYRYAFYQKNKIFYQKLLQEKIFSLLPKANKTYLYCPTWEDAEGSCSFFITFEHLLSSLPKEINLIIKVHPNTLAQKADRIEICKGKAALHKNVFFLEDFPAIYSLLDACDLLIGDASSIGYDFLSFNKPLVFLPGEKPLISDLYSCGLSLPKDRLHKIYQEIDEYHLKGVSRDEKNRLALHQLTFDI